jgi:hypothetical protein
MTSEEARLRSTGRIRHRGVALAVGLVALLVVTAVAGAAPGPPLVRLNAYGATPIPSFGMARTANGVLHLIYDTLPPGGGPSTGLTTQTISPSGTAGPVIPALTGWAPGRPGLTALPDGTLVAVFGALSPGTSPVSSIWSISSTDGGATWSAPVDVSSGTDEALAYGSDMTLQAFGSTPVLTAPQAGGLVVQQGLGPGAPTALDTDSSDNFAGIVNTAVDAATQQVVASWSSAAGTGGDYIRAVAPAPSLVVKSPGQLRTGLVIAGRDTGPGIFAAYTTDNRKVRLLRYGGGSVAVGSSPTVTPQVLAVATGPQGRIWVMWGDEAGNPGLVVTRSNKAVTKFEPLQEIGMHALQLQRIGGDGRLGPLDLLVDYRPTSTGPLAVPGLFHARVYPVLSAAVSTKAVKNKKGVVVAHKVTVKVKDAGDPVAGAKVAIGGSKGTTSGNGTTTLTLPAAVSGAKALTVIAAGYQELKLTVHI